MKLQKGFSLIELMVSMGIVVTVVAIATGTLLQAEHATTAVSYMANTQENLRAGMHFMVRDLMQAGEGIPQGGVSLPILGHFGDQSPRYEPGRHISRHLHHAAGDHSRLPGWAVRHLSESHHWCHAHRRENRHYQYHLRGQHSAGHGESLSLQLSHHTGRTIHSGLCGDDQR